MFSRDVLISLGALEKGVIIPGCNVEQYLQKMSPDEARRAKRKWRKLFRLARKKVDLHPSLSKMNDKYKERAAWSCVIELLAQVGRKKIGEDS